MLLFDLDGTITDSNGLWLDVDIAFVGRRGYQVTQEYTDFVTHAIFPTAADFTKEYYHLSESLQEIMDEWMSLAYDQYAHHVPAKSGAAAFLRACQARGEVMGMVTASVPELCRVVLDRLGLSDCFSFLLFAQELGLEKRDPRVFLEAAKRGGVLPEQCTVFDDSPVACQSAKTAGCRTIGVYDPLYAQYEAEMRRHCDGYIMSFEELL